MDSLDNIIVVGDRLLIKPKTDNNRTKSGLYLPPGTKEKEQVHQGYVIKVGPGYPIPSLNEMDEPWKKKADQTQYIPLQAQEGDLATYLGKNTYEVELNGEKYVIVAQSSVLFLMREEGLFE